MIKIVYLSCCAVVLMACGTTRKVQQSPVADTTTTTALESMHTVLAKLNKITYTTFSGKAEIEYTDAKGKSTHLNAKIQMSKDQYIWISAIGPFGIEAARMLITKDSVKVLNKIEKEYLTGSLAFVQRKLGLPVDLPTLQDLLIGNPVFIDTTNSSYTQNGNTLALSSHTRVFNNLITIALPGYWMTQSMLTDTDASRNRSAQLLYDDYKPAGNFSFATARNISITHNGKTTLRLDYKNFTFNESLSVPFSVPSGYKKVTE